MYVYYRIYLDMVLDRKFSKVDLVIAYVLRIFFILWKFHSSVGFSFIAFLFIIPANHAYNFLKFHCIRPVYSVSISSLLHFDRCSFWSGPFTRLFPLSMQFFPLVSLEMVPLTFEFLVLDSTLSLFL